jgi:hypothetical protein
MNLFKIWKNLTIVIMNDNIINKPIDIWEKRLDELFSHKKENSSQQFLDVLSMIIYQSDNKDLSNLFSILDFDSFLKVISLFDGRTVAFPTKEALKDSVEVALYFYYKEIKGIDSYDKLKSLNIRDSEDFSSRSIGRKINKLKRDINESICDALRRIDND